MFRKMPFILFALIVLAGLTHSWIPVSCKSALYAISLTLKSGILFILPFLIFGLLFKTAVQLSKKASKLILFLLGAICLSNFLSTLISYGIGTLAYQTDLSLHLIEAGSGLTPAWNFSLPKWVGNGFAMFFGLLLGIVLGRWKPAWAAILSSRIEKAIFTFFKLFLFVIPLFILGFVIQMYHDQLMGQIIRSYGSIFILISLALFAYITLIYWTANGKGLLQSFKNMMPAAIAGFGSMSSAAAMPLTILGTEKNAQNPDLARSVIPATVNIHLIGDCFAIPIFAFAVLKSFGIAEPSFFAYLIFAAYFVLAKFSVAAVPGGGILVMLPILETYLGFDASMLSLITALYILFDPVITCANVLGNGGFAMGIDKLFKKQFAEVRYGTTNDR